MKMQATQVLAINIIIIICNCTSGKLNITIAKQLLLHQSKDLVANGTRHADWWSASHMPCLAIPQHARTGRKDLKALSELKYVKEEMLI